LDFDWEEIGQVISYLVPVVAFIVFNVIFRKKQQQKRQQQVVRSLLSEIDYNQKLMETFLFKWQSKKFKTGTWKSNRDKMDYIDQSLHNTLAGAYEIAEEFNSEIDAAKKHKSSSYLAGIRVDRLKGPLARSRQGLEEWLELNKRAKEMPRPGGKLN
jgi:hypothetical protein